MNIRLIEHNSEAYEQMILLRLHVLLKPIGIPLSFIQPDKEKDDVLIGSFENNDLTGCCILTERDEDIVQLRQMAVDTRTQGTGVGAAIMEYAEDLARARGYRKLLLNARDSVMPFYEKCGYTAEGDGFMEVGIAHHTMIKAL